MSANKSFNIGTVFKIIGAVTLIGLLGTCVWTFSGLFKNISEAKERTSAFLDETFLVGDLPAEGSAIYSKIGGGWEQASIDRVNAYVTQAGPVSSSDEPECGAQNLVGQDDRPDGSYTTCETIHTVPGGQMASTIIWKIEKDGWKLFSLNYKPHTPVAEGDETKQK